MRRKHAAHENHERWLVSYADFITLLFAFFVVMFATSQSDKSKAKQVSDSVRDALEHGQLTAALSNALGRGKRENGMPPDEADGAAHPESAASKTTPTAPGAAPADLAKSLGVLQQGLAPELASGKLGLKLERRGLVISFHESAYFASGDDAIPADGFASIGKIAAEVRRLPNPMRFEGHTDSVPIHNSRFRSNWELSAARAIAMMELFRGRFEIPSARMSVGGYAENAPVDSNQTAAGRARNRRVDLVVLSAEALLNEPQPAGLPPARAP
jgi:chemotaxis protein MotB